MIIRAGRNKIFGIQKISLTDSIRVKYQVRIRMSNFFEGPNFRFQN